MLKKLLAESISTFAPVFAGAGALTHVGTEMAEPTGLEPYKDKMLR